MEIQIVKYYAVTVTTPTNGTITVKNGEADVNSGDYVPANTSLTLTATPADNYSLEKWTIGDTDYTENPKTFTVTNDVTVSASFTANAIPAFSLDGFIADNGNSYTTETHVLTTASGWSGMQLWIGNNSTYHGSKLVIKTTEDCRLKVTVGYVSEPRQVSIASMFSNGIPFGYSTNDLIMEVCDMELFDALGEPHEVPYIDVKNNANNYKMVKLLSYEKIAQWKMYKQYSNRYDKVKCTQKINAIDKFLFVNDTIKDDNGFVLQQKVIDYGYAHTIHKSQGSTFENVLINDNDINICDDETTKRQLRYVALTRARQKAIIITNH